MLDTLDEPLTQMRRRVLAALTALWGVGFVLVCRVIGAGAGDNLSLIHIFGSATRSFFPSSF